ncbi:SURF1 family protein [Actinopolymorpha sp. B17G11]|uniref:SURF1 family cytochrome oxidase biogenesis protein n=1 Tax=Actinopolymorpha sp. B17G11 TaxID=3160861 RepID=UPI0032E4FA5D
MYRFLLRPRWIALVIIVALLVAVFVQLGRWQLHRLDDRRAHNAVITTNSSAAAKPLDTVLAPGRPVAAGQEWTRVSARGRYDGSHQILVRYRSQGGEPGFNVLSPLVTSRGAAVLVNRGWVPRTASVQAPEPPAVPTGEVRVLGRVRPSEAADPGSGAPRDGQVRFIDVEQIAAHLPYPVVGGYLELIEPPGAGQASESSPRVLPPPELSEGPHLSYAVQWFLFALIAVLGVGFLAYDEAHDGRLRTRIRTAERGPRPVPAGDRSRPE